MACRAWANVKLLIHRCVRQLQCTVAVLSRVCCARRGAHAAQYRNGSLSNDNGALSLPAAPASPAPSSSPTCEFTCLRRWHCVQRCGMGLGCDNAVKQRVLALLGVNTAACRAEPSANESRRLPPTATACAARMRAAKRRDKAARRGGASTAAAAWTMRMIVRWRICMLDLAGRHSYRERLNRPTVVVSAVVRASVRHRLARGRAAARE